MHRYHVVSGTLFTIMAIAQLVRAILAWPLQVDGVSVPVWISGVAFLIVGSMAVWAFRSGRAPAAI